MKAKMRRNNNGNVQVGVALVGMVGKQVLVLVESAREMLSRRAFYIALIRSKSWNSLNVTLSTEWKGDYDGESNEKIRLNKMQQLQN